MKTLVDENRKLERKFIKLLLKMPPDRFFGVTTILGIKLSEEEKDKLGKVVTKDQNDIEEKDKEKEATTEVNEDVSADKNEENKEPAAELIDNSQDTIDERSEDEKIEDVLGLVVKTIDKFKALKLQQKKSLLKIMKAGV